MSIDARWAWAFLDTPADKLAGTIDFWTRATGTRTSPWRGEEGEFATLLPLDGGRPWLKAQRLASGAAMVHLDLDVDDLGPAADVATGLGSSVVADHGDLGYVVLRSPGGYVFCLTTADPDLAAMPTSPPGPTRVDQVCLDVPADAFDAEAAFWTDLTGWERHRSSVRPEFDWLRRPEGHPIRLLLQRLEETTGPVRAHLDAACSDRPTAVGQHVALGAEIRDVQPFWTVMADPTGRVYCLTDRDPATGALPG